jgi:hypothetical protein
MPAPRADFANLAKHCLPWKNQNSQFVTVELNSGLISVPTEAGVLASDPVVLALDKIADLKRQRHSLAGLNIGRFDDPWLAPLRACIPDLTLHAEGWTIAYVNHHQVILCVGFSTRKHLSV